MLGVCVILVFVVSKQKGKGESYMEVRNEIKSYIVGEGLSMREVLERLVVTHGWSGSVSNLSAKLRRGTIRYEEVRELADVLEYDLVWRKKK